MKLLFATMLPALLALAGCQGTRTAVQAQSAASAAVATTTAKGPVDGERAMGYVRQVVAFGPRPVGSPAHQRLEGWLRSQLRGITLEEDAFTASTPAGQLPMRNLMAKIPGDKDGLIVIAGHYDTNYPLKNFVGANDGGSSTALLLELANVLRSPKRQGYSIWLVWFDGEEAIRQWSSTDSLYGSRHLAAKWEREGMLRQIKAFLLLDMIGDADLDIERDLNSTPWLLDVVAEAATRLGVQSYFFRRENQIEDDHVPFARRGVPVADIIDLDYGPNNAYHHSPEDTLDKLSPRSLEIVGNTVVETIKLLENHP